VVQPPPPGYTDWPGLLQAQGLRVEADAASAVVDPAGLGPRLYFQRVAEPKTAKNRMHLDLNISDARRAGPVEGRRRVEVHMAKALGLGAVEQRRFEQNDEFWVVLLDPEGNEFCVQ